MITNFGIRHDGWWSVFYSQQSCNGKHGPTTSSDATKVSGWRIWDNTETVWYSSTSQPEATELGMHCLDFLMLSIFPWVNPPFWDSMGNHRCKSMVLQGSVPAKPRHFWARLSHVGGATWQDVKESRTVLQLDARRYSLGNEVRFEAGVWRENLNRKPWFPQCRGVLSICKTPTSLVRLESSTSSASWWTNASSSLQGHPDFDFWANLGTQNLGYFHGKFKVQPRKINCFGTRHRRYAEKWGPADVFSHFHLLLKELIVSYHVIPCHTMSYRYCSITSLHLLGIPLDQNHTRDHFPASPGDRRPYLGVWGEGTACL
jgi:hypothetical protein